MTVECRQNGRDSISCVMIQTFFKAEKGVCTVAMQLSTSEEFARAGTGVWRANPPGGGPCDVHGAVELRKEASGRWYFRQFKRRNNLKHASCSALPKEEILEYRWDGGIRLQCSALVLGLVR